MKQRIINAHMEAAQVYARLSYCNKRKVGCVIVKNDRIVSIGYNGTPPGDDNRCEDMSGKTKPSVVHAEHNAIKKLEESGETGDTATLFVTASPCIQCAEKIINFGIKQVFFLHERRNLSGLDVLRANGVAVDKLQ